MEPDTPVAKDSSSLCRCCLSEESEDGTYRALTKRYRWIAETEIYADMLRQCFNISIYIQPDAPGHNLICDVCIILLRDAYHFKKQVVDSQRKFADIMLPQRKGINNDSINEDDSANHDIFGEPEDIEAEHIESGDNGLEKCEKGNVNTAATSSSNNVECNVELEEMRDQLVCLPTGEWKAIAGFRRRKKKHATASDDIPPDLNQQHDALTARSNHKTHICDICGKSYNRNAKLKEHKLTHGNKTFVCDICGKSFFIEHYLEKHMRIHKGPKPFSCDTCGTSFRRNHLLKKHLLTHSDTETRQFSCDTCHNSFDSEKSMMNHSHSGTDLKPFACYVCNKCFVQKSHLRRHLQYVHNDTKEFSCHICGITLKEERTLRKHLLSHSSDESFNCDICEKSFKLKEYLKQHISYVHSAAEPVSCNICGKSLKLKRYLTEHMIQVHGGARPFDCHICGKRFKLKANLKDHLLRHSKTKPFACRICDKAFSGKSCLRKHLKRHNEKKIG